jgi:coenzyme PQQ synthesis protein D (PqqD)
MRERLQQAIPRARTEGLIVQEMADEVLIYDLDRHKAHCLNSTAALIWKSCDGRKTAAQVARALEAQLDSPIDEQVVWLGIDELGKAHLLAAERRAERAGLSRRDLLKRAGLAAVVALPLVTSIVAPEAAQAATCRTQGQSCMTSADCCIGPCSGGTCAA